MNLWSQIAFCMESASRFHYVVRAHSQSGVFAWVYIFSQANVCLSNNTHTHTRAIAVARCFPEIIGIEWRCETRNKTMNASIRPQARAKGILAAHRHSAPALWLRFWVVWNNPRLVKRYAECMHLSMHTLCQFHSHQTIIECEIMK